MRWCSHCRNFNTGWPARCRYCAVGLDGRLCPRNHVNPTDSRLAFCGECGQPLERKSGAGFSPVPYAVSAGICLASFALAALLVVVSQEE